MTSSMVEIRPVNVMDAQFVLHWENNIEGWNLDTNETPYSILDILNLIHELSDIQKAKQGRWIICEDERPIGAVDLTEIDFEKKEASVGVLIAESEDRGKGYAQLALAYIEQQALDLGIHRLISTILVNNSTSVHLFEKCGFGKIGKSNDSYLVDGVYIEALLLEKWLKK